MITQMIIITGEKSIAISDINAWLKTEAMETS